MLCANIIVPVMYIVIKKFKQKNTYIRLYAASGRYRNDWEYRQDNLANLL